MGSFLEDEIIHASVILDIWAELYGKGSRTTCMRYLEDLASQNLLKLVLLGNELEDGGFYNDYRVTQHDILRELSICQSELKEHLERKRLNLDIREDTFPDWCLDLTHPINARLFSISSDDLFSSSWVKMDCPNVEALVLNISISNYALPSFISGMRKLKVIAITHHKFSPVRLSNFSCLSSLPNLKRMKLERASLTLTDIHQLQLNNLRKLFLVKCSLRELFYDSEEKNVSQPLQSLQEIEIDHCGDIDELPYWIAEVSSLKTLSISNCLNLSKLPEEVGNLGKLEVLRLNSSINLLELLETIVELNNLWFLDISDCLRLRKLPLEIGKLEKLKKIY